MYWKEDFCSSDSNPHSIPDKKYSWMHFTIYNFKSRWEKREKTEPYSGIRYTHIYPHKLQVEGLTSLTQHFSTKKTIVKNMLRGMED